VVGVATVTIQAERAALGMVGVAEASRDVVIGEPEGEYNGSTVVRYELIWGVEGHERPNAP